MGDGKFFCGVMFAIEECTLNTKSFTGQIYHLFTILIIGVLFYFFKDICQGVNVTVCFNLADCEWNN